MSNSDSDSEPEVQDQPEESQAHVKEILQKAKTIMPSYDVSLDYYEGIHPLSNLQTLMLLH